MLVCFQILESHLDELCYQCFCVEDYNKVFHHYNFKVKMRKSDSADWTVTLYFAVLDVYVYLVFSHCIRGFVHIS